MGFLGIVAKNYNRSAISPYGCLHYMIRRYNELWEIPLNFLHDWSLRTIYYFSMNSKLYTIQFIRREDTRLPFLLTVRYYHMP